MMFRVYRDALGPELNRAVYADALALRGHFEPSRVTRRVDTETRRSTVVYDQHLTRWTGVLRGLLDERLDDVLAGLGIEPFAVSGMEIQLTAHGDGEYFHRHTDAASAETAGRALTYVYYFHAEPRGHSGGEIVFFGPDGEEHVLEPGNDTLVVFDPHTPHEVRPVRCPSGRFEDGRFTLNGWLRRRNPPRETFFDQRIFSRVGSWPGVTGIPRPRATHAPAPASAASGADEAITGLLSDLQWTRRRPRAVDEAVDLSPDEFFDRWFSMNRPVVLRGALASSPAVARWTPAWFAEHYSDVPIDITTGRGSAGDYELRFRETVRTVPFGEFLRRLDGAVGNEEYLVARNNFFENPRLRHLRDDLRPPAGIIDDANWAPGATKLWIGPEGTVTPLHFDEHAILFTQVFGRKRVKLVPAVDHAYVYPRDRFYSWVDPENVDTQRFPLFSRACVINVVVEPGDALLLPAGWWHWVRSFSASISATFSAFAVPGGNVRLRRFS